MELVDEIQMWLWIILSIQKTYEWKWDPQRCIYWISGVYACVCVCVEECRPDGHRLLHTRLRLCFVCSYWFLLMAWLIYTSLELVIAVACCLGNMLVVWAMCLRQTFRQPTFCFVASLAVADFLVGAVAVPLAVLVDGWVEIPFQACLAVSCVVLVLTQASVLSLLAIAVDRYLRVSIPLR